MSAAESDTLRRAARLMRERAQEAAMHPDVALAVANLLETAAYLNKYGSTASLQTKACALDIARAYLGEAPDCRTEHAQTCERCKRQ